MSKELDEWAFWLGAVGFILFLAWLGLEWAFTVLPANIINFLHFLNILLSSLPNLMIYSGLILGVVALIKGSNKRWKPIMAVIFFVMMMIIYQIYKLTPLATAF